MRAEVEMGWLRQAVGLATTCVPSMEMDCEHPIEMMQQVCAKVARLREWNDEQYQTIRGLQDDLRRLEGIITAARAALVTEVKP
jgi:hypothetical protein